MPRMYFHTPRFTRLVWPDFPVTVVKLLRPAVVFRFTIRIRNPNSIMMTARMLASPARCTFISTYLVLSVENFR